MSLPDGVSANKLTPSITACKLIYNFSLKFNAIQKCVSERLFTTFLYEMADRIQKIFLEELILVHYFNRDGACQLQADVKMGLFSIFNLFIKNIEFTFSK